MGNTQSSLNLYVKHLGIAYLIYITLGMVNSLFLKQGIYDFKAFDETEVRFRFAQAVDITMFLAVIWASWAQYLVTKAINKNIAFLALILRVGEGLLGLAATAITLTAIVVLSNEQLATAFQDEQLRALASIFVKMTVPMWDILLITMGIGAALFMYLFYISIYVPKWLALWGILTYVSMIAYAGANILLINPPAILRDFMLPGALFEVTFGVWLLVKGINNAQANASQS